MTIHYHGTPITPKAKLHELAGCHFCVSFARPDDVHVVHSIGQSVMLDNGAYSAWKRGITIDWSAYFEFCREWFKFPATWAVIPDSIDGGREENDRLVKLWPFGRARGAPVWHLDESPERLVLLCAEWPRVCIGSAGAYSVVGSLKWHERMVEAMNMLWTAIPTCSTWLHMLRGMSLSGSLYPFASLDSTDVARNHNRGGSIVERARRWDRVQCPPRWKPMPAQHYLFTETEDPLSSGAVPPGRE